MATVYKAFDNRLERQVAIKFIRRDKECMKMKHKRFGLAYLSRLYF